MNPLPYLAGLAMRHAWAEREYARLHADIVEARITARARETERAAERAARARRWLLGGVPDLALIPIRRCRRRGTGRSQWATHQ
ncbi:hypothetical protein [Actinomadura sp. BRA 177]|uniref:hypothetical protein n=1 Tax=Actinomadura sp. BRA 177 TaxID=2745202 RepID=UPI00159632A4|nr:hypothetical protein [Actinomadura sp. BRA 177]